MIFKEFFKKDLRIALTYKTSFILDILSLFLHSISWFFISKLVTRTDFDVQTNYFSYVVVGYTFYMFLAFFLQHFPSIIRSSQMTGTLESVITSPISLWKYLMASTSFSFLKTIIKAAAYLFFAIILFGLTINSVDLIALIVLFIVGIMSFIGLGIMLGAISVLIKQNLAFWVNFYFQLVSNLYYPLSILPEFLRVLALLSPLYYYLSALRKILFSGATLFDLFYEIKILTLFALVIVPISYWFFLYAIRRTKKDGTLVEY